MLINGIFNGEKYIEILKEVMIQNLRAIYPKPEVFYFIEDNSPLHIIKIVKKWFED